MRNGRNKPKRYVHEFAHDAITFYFAVMSEYPQNYELFNERINKINRVVSMYDKGMITSFEAVSEISKIERGQ